MVIDDKFILNFFCSPSFPLVFINFTNMAMINVEIGNSSLFITLGATVISVNVFNTTIPKL